jgi:hypothetical protein
MTIQFTAPQQSSIFKVGDRVKIDLTPLYKKSPYEFIEGTIYMVRVDFPLIWSNKPNYVHQMAELKFKYGIQPDTALYPKMKEADDKLYDVPEEHLIEI